MTDESKTQSLAGEVISLARDMIVMNMRFLDIAVFALKPVAGKNTEGASCDGTFFYYDPVWLLGMCKKEPDFALRLYLHSLMHCIFLHRAEGEGKDRRLWDIACDLAVEKTILGLGLKEAVLEKDQRLEAAVKELEELMNPDEKDEYVSNRLWVQDGKSASSQKSRIPFTAGHIYAFLSGGGADEEFIDVLEKLSYVDDHACWSQKIVTKSSDEVFKRIAERVKTGMKSFSKGRGKGKDMLLNLKQATGERHDYAEILRNFSCLAEDIAVNDDEFDYIYYNYGLEHYGNMPLIEPLEYREVKKVRDFVIVIDTSSSCSKGLTQAFLLTTVEILKSTDSFFSVTNIHILQCDNAVRNDTVIKDIKEIEEYAGKVKINGLGATDFRPAFEYVDELIGNETLTDMKGLIYFTDGYGIYPEAMPAYKVMFAFMSEDENRPAHPKWAAGLVVDDLKKAGKDK
ncbi:MAG: hypothetical protein J5842_08780 [Lachnospiraceae bacterium]|nr:hypothetical protein [Lachnospiraceae bacterium]